MLQMDTPTSQAQANAPAARFDICLSQLTAGTFAYGQLAAFSDLSREHLRQLNHSWLVIALPIRRRLIADAIELAEENVHYRFDRLYRFALSDPNEEIRQLAISGLWEDETRSLLLELIEISQEDTSQDVRAAAISFLGDAVARLRSAGDDADLGDRINELVMHFCGDKTLSTLIRRRAIEAVGGLEQTAETRQVILDAYQHGDQTLEAGAIEAMGRSHESRWRPLVLPILRSADAELRFEAARALGRIGTGDDVPDLSELTLDDDPDVRGAAIHALGDLGGPGAVRVLRNLAADAPESDREAIEDAIDSAMLANDPIRTPA